MWTYKIQFFWYFYCYFIVLCVWEFPHRWNIIKCFQCLKYYDIGFTHLKHISYVTRILCGRPFEETFDNYASSQAIWWHNWKCTEEKSQTNATNVTMPLHLHAIWGDIWKHTVEKSQTNASLHPWALRTHLKMHSRIKVKQTQLLQLHIFACRRS